MNLSPAGVPSRFGLRLPTLEADLDPSLDGDLLGVLEGVFFVSDSLSLFRPDPPPPSRDPLRPALILSDVFWFSKAFLGRLRAALLMEVSILVASFIAFSNSN